MRKYFPLFLILTFLLSSCSSDKVKAITESERISFLSSYGIEINTKRPYYSSVAMVPEIFDTIWEIRSIFSKDILNIDIGSYKGKQCQIYMYPVQKLPFNIKKSESVEAKATVICYKDSIICSYIEFISELRGMPPLSLKGTSLVDMSGLKWESWRDRVDSDGDKRLVIWQYYNSLRSGNYEDAYKYIYDKTNIKKEDFIKAAKANSLLYIDFLDISQYQNPTADECYFRVKAKVGDSQGKLKNEVYDITFDLKRDSKEKEYGGWKIFKTKIK